ncbi:response regulator transcription factor [Gracilibacillus dipsosauri]|uniref:DNA-binding response regulator n=1 Tax=Gracilibacillus dipsosauri TaxID=178340 RepID=A0A317KTM8_9BACI|nr:response regulator transcription factor [Gracilibacillus dipsosauri]PWU66795.1 DNA-binding response regulator [Gracilibacillus dipsosauri]
MIKPTVLIVDDERQMRTMLKLHLRNKYEWIEASNGREAIDKMKENDVSIVLLDIMMPELDGMEACKKMKEMRPDVPIILLTALNDTSQKVEGLNIGADDYIVKPFEPEELIARMKVQLRHFSHTKEKTTNQQVNFAEWSIDPQARSVKVKGNELKYSPKEFDLLYLLASHPNRVYTREQLLDMIWGMDEIVDIRTVDSHVRYVRDKLKKAGLPYQPIQTIWGVGYKFITEDSNEVK